MRKAVLIILTILVLLAVAAVAYTWVNALVNSIYGYRSPLKVSPPLTEDVSRPLTSQVVLILADGLRGCPMICRGWRRPIRGSRSV